MAHTSIHASHGRCSFHSDFHDAHSDQGVLPTSGFLSVEVKEERAGTKHSEDRLTFHVKRDSARQLIDVLEEQYSRIFIDPYENFCKQHGYTILGSTYSEDNTWRVGTIHGNIAVNFNFKTMEAAMDAVVDKVQNGEWPGYVQQYLNELAAQDNFHEQCALAQQEQAEAAAVRRNAQRGFPYEEGLSDEWRPADQDTAIACGWGIFRNGEHSEIQRIDDPHRGNPVFESDEDARAEVSRLAARGNLFCQRALRVVSPADPTYG